MLSLERPPPQGRRRGGSTRGRFCGGFFFGRRLGKTGKSIGIVGMSRRLPLAIGSRFGTGGLPTRYRTPRGPHQVIWTDVTSVAPGQLRVSTSDLLPMALAGPGFGSRREEGEFASSVYGHAGYADKGFVPSGTLVANRLRLAHDRMLQRQRLTYRPGVRPIVAATLNPNALPIVSPASVSAGAGADRAAFGPAGPADQTMPAFAPFGVGQRNLGGLRGLANCDRGLHGSFAARQAPPGIGWLSSPPSLRIRSLRADDPNGQGRFSDRLNPRI